MPSGQSNMGSWGGGSPIGDGAAGSNLGGEQLGSVPDNIAEIAQSVPLVNGTPVIFSELVPADGNVHFFSLIAGLVVTTNETGGAVQIQYRLGGNLNTIAVFAAAQLTGSFVFSTSFAADPGSTITLSQSSALTAGASKISAVLDLIV